MKAEVIASADIAVLAKHLKVIFVGKQIFQADLFEVAGGIGRLQDIAVRIHQLKRQVALCVQEVDSSLVGWLGGC